MTNKKTAKSRKKNNVRIKHCTKTILKRIQFVTNTYRQTHAHTFDLFFRKNTSIVLTQIQHKFLNKIFREGSIHYTRTHNFLKRTLTHMSKYIIYKLPQWYMVRIPQINRLTYIMGNYYEHKFTEMKAHMCNNCLLHKAVTWPFSSVIFTDSFGWDYKTRNVGNECT